MDKGLSVRAAMREATSTISGNFVVFSLPLIVYIGCFEVATNHTAHHPRPIWAILGDVGVFALYIAIGIVLQAGVSDLYLSSKLHGVRPTVTKTFEPTGYLGFFQTVGRLVARYIGWFVPGILAGLILYSLLALFHHGAVKGPSHLRTLLGAAIFDAIASQYGFVIPLLVLHRSGGRERFRNAVTLARHYWGTLALIAVAETIILLVPNDLIKDLLTRHAASQAMVISWQCLNALFIAVFSAWYSILRTALMMQARTRAEVPLP